MTRTFSESELILNPDGSVFHLHLRPEYLAEKIILVGDQQRVPLVASHFENLELDIQNREFHTITGTYNQKRISVISTGIGCGNIDIVMNELDALVNIDLQKRQLRRAHHSLEIVRIGTCGGLQSFTPEGTFVASVASIGMDGLLNFYAKRNDVCNKELEDEFIAHMEWENPYVRPYAVQGDPSLLKRIATDDMVQGITVTCGGFYGPQGRKLRLAPMDNHLNDKLRTFAYKDLHITNFEMESSAIAGMALMLGHKAMTCCLVIANRIKGRAYTSYKHTINELITKVLDRI